MKILSVDDSRTARQIIRNAVEILGFDFIEAENGIQALEILRKQDVPVDLILLDWNMPEMDGLQTLGALKADDALKNIPVTMVTTEVERVRVVMAIAAGAKNYVMKPFSQEDLIAKIMESLGLGL
jgi:two-component system chemotaxis response regulator CheY